MTQFDELTFCYEIREDCYQAIARLYLGLRSDIK